MNKIKQLVKGLVQKHGTNDPWDLCEKLKVIVLVADLPTNIHGFYHCINKQQIIHISRWISNSQMKMVCAHELGHVILHGHRNMYTVEHTATLEQEAEEFKFWLLNLRGLSTEFPTFDPVEIAQFANLPPEALILDF
ncbi:MAG: ImmA/IrrE family metallo-endopeptidase [Oscillospiraceae bacterium]|nr:ImmA/IrrE family metallo-endopeptidase [Oscillospiraceae bacterium]